MINSSRSERGWQGRRRIAVLVSIVGVLGIAALGSTSTASAAAVAGCKAKLEAEGQPELDQREAQLHLRRARPHLRRGLEQGDQELQRPKCGRCQFVLHL